MTARTPYQAGGGDVSATLGELERKLRELEQELNATSRPADATVPVAVPQPPAPTPAPAPPGRDADALIAQARARLGSLDGQVDELLRFREQLHRTARELEDEYSRVLARLGAPAPEVAPAPIPVRAPIVPPADEAALLPNHPVFAQPEQTLATPLVAEHVPVPVAPMHQVPQAFPPAAPLAPAAPTSPYEETLFDGAIVLDAGPFTDIAALSGFEQAIARVPGAEDVYVSGFEGNRALVEMRLSRPIALVREMRHAVPAPFTVTDAAAGRLRLDVSTFTSGS